MPAAMTELEAVNLMLSVVGEAPVSDLEDATIAEVALAVRILEETSYEVQAKGWDFNTEYNYPLSPDVDGYINVPSDTARIDVDPIYGETSLDVVQRGERLYDRTNRTYIFTISEIRCEMVLLLDFDDLPEAARRYITVRAARKFQDRILGSDSVHAYNLQDEEDAKALFLQAESSNGDHSIFDHWSVGQTLDR